MIIYFFDGSKMECNEILLSGDMLLVDHVRYVHICDIDRIETA